jgi:predicted NBD/HSP70 family sugar kinase
MLVAVDTGGTKTLVASFLEDGSVGKQSKIPTPPDEKTYVTELTNEILGILDGKAASVISIGLPGRIDPNGILLGAGNLEWKNFDLRKELSSTFDCPIIIENDANLAGLAETRQLKNIPPVSLYVTVSTGIGTGIILNGKIEPHFSQSEGGSMILERDGSLRKWESFASGKAVVEAYGKYARDITSERAWKQIGYNIAVGIMAMSPVLRPDIVIIGGSMGVFFDKYKKYLNNYLIENMKPHYVPKIVEAAHPELAVIYGCYYYALDALASA